VTRRFVIGALLASTSFGVQQGAPPAPPRNVMLIVLDDIGTELIGAYDAIARTRGQPSGVAASTPAIDNLLAARGVTFTHCWTAPMCTPSRAQMLTGRHGFRTGVGRVLPHSAAEKDFDNPGLAIEQALLPSVLHGAPKRYACGAVGKWHLASATQLGEHPAHPLGEPRGQWFDCYAGSLFNLQDPDRGPGSPTGYWRWVKTYASALGPESNPCGDAPLPCDVVSTKYATADTADDAIALAKSLPEPWFLYVAFNAAHAPEHDVPRELPRAKCDGYEPPKEPCNAATTPERVRCMLAEADAQIARVLCAVGDETAVILIGDNGTSEDAVMPPFAPERAKD
jgi:arylsulfatase B